MRVSDEMFLRLPDSLVEWLSEINHRPAKVIGYTLVQN